jgi:hypothetical protein
MKDEFLKPMLKKMKSIVSNGNFTLADREKNTKFLRDRGLNDDCVKESILQLSPNDYRNGPEEDRDGYPGFIYKFKVDYLTDEIIYIKIRYNPPEEVVCISFHDDE